MFLYLKKKRLAYAFWKAELRREGASERNLSSIGSLHKWSPTARVGPAQSQALLERSLTWMTQALEPPSVDFPDLSREPDQKWSTRNTKVAGGSFTCYTTMTTPSLLFFSNKKTVSPWVLFFFHFLKVVVTVSLSTSLSPFIDCYFNIVCG